LSEWHLAAVWQAAKKKPHKYGDDLLPILPRRKNKKEKNSSTLLWAAKENRYFTELALVKR